MKKTGTQCKKIEWLKKPRSKRVYDLCPFLFNAQMFYICLCKRMNLHISQNVLQILVSYSYFNSSDNITTWACEFFAFKFDIPDSECIENVF